TRHLTSLSDLTTDGFHHIVRRGAEIARDRSAVDRSLTGRIVGTYFRRTSTRTRTAFTAGALRLGASVIAYGPADLQENTGETADDTGQVLGGMLDAFVARTAGSGEEMRSYAGGSMAVINAMTAREHPTQALTDLSTMLVHFGRIEGITVRYVGEGNNS